MNEVKKRIILLLFMIGIYHVPLSQTLIDKRNVTFYLCQPSTLSKPILSAYFYSINLLDRYRTHNKEYTI